MVFCLNNRNDFFLLLLLHLPAKSANIFLTTARRTKGNKNPLRTLRCGNKRGRQRKRMTLIAQISHSKTITNKYYFLYLCPSFSPSSSAQTVCVCECFRWLPSDFCYINAGIIVLRSLNAVQWIFTETRFMYLTHNLVLKPKWLLCVYEFAECSWNVCFVCCLA